MELTDTHTHLYLPEFDTDRHEMMSRAVGAGVNRFFLPNIDSGSVDAMLTLCREYPGKCFPMIGLHPCSVKAGYKEELKSIERRLDEEKYCGIGEAGLDLYWDKTFFSEQKDALTIQAGWAKETGLPLIIHSREAFQEVLSVLEPLQDGRLKGIFHCFSGSRDEAQRGIDLGFHLGIGGVVTFKNSGLDKVVEALDPRWLVLETDAPYLAPVPFRGKRNESAYLQIIAKKIADLQGISLQQLAEITTANATKIFGI